MAQEIERKFLVIGDAWRALAVRRARMSQGYVASADRSSVRVRITADVAHLNIKVGGLEAVRQEFEYRIPAEDAEALLAAAKGPLIEKTRHFVPHEGFEWEVDEFHGANAGLVVAEIELDSEQQAFPLPPWVGAEVTHLPRYYNVKLVSRPYAEWTAAERAAPVRLEVDLAAQRLALVEDGRATRLYRVSTSKHGAGELSGSYRTPRGRHIVRAKIGGGAPLGAVFRGRRPTGEVYSPELAAAHPDRDWILTRILWLSGTEVGRNRLGSVDTMRRYIYIHGAPDSEPMGVPGSIGCIRMRNDEIVELFEQVPVGTVVDIS